MFLPYDEKIDEKCYKLNKMDNWANSFYNIKSKNLIEKYIRLVSKIEFSTFFEALNYEYGTNNYPLDTKKPLKYIKMQLIILLTHLVCIGYITYIKKILKNLI